MYITHADEVHDAQSMLLLADDLEPLRLGTELGPEAARCSIHATDRPDTGQRKVDADPESIICASGSHCCQARKILGKPARPG